MRIGWWETQEAPFEISVGIAELKITNEVTYNSAIERLTDPKTAVKQIERECLIQLRGQLPVEPHTHKRLL